MKQPATAHEIGVSECGEFPPVEKDQCEGSLFCLQHSLVAGADGTSIWTGARKPDMKPTDTMYYQCHATEPTHLPLDTWKPWIHCHGEDIERLRRIVLHRFLRDRGGIAGDRMTVFLFEHTSDAPRHSNGTPMTITSVKYEVSR